MTATEFGLGLLYIAVAAIWYAAGWWQGKTVERDRREERAAGQDQLALRDQQGQGPEVITPGAASWLRDGYPAPVRVPRSLQLEERLMTPASIGMRSTGQLAVSPSRLHETQPRQSITPSGAAAAFLGDCDATPSTAHEKSPGESGALSSPAEQATPADRTIIRFQRELGIDNGKRIGHGAPECERTVASGMSEEWSSHKLRIR
jgi:hypothetical protein